MQTLSSWDVLVWIGGVLGLGAFVAWYFQEFLKAYFPKLNPARIGRVAQQRDLPLPSGERFVVLIADLQGDDQEKMHTRHVAAALGPYKGLDVHRIGPGLNGTSAAATISRPKRANCWRRTRETC